MKNSAKKLIRSLNQVVKQIRKKSGMRELDNAQFVLDSLFDGERGTVSPLSAALNSEGPQPDGLVLH